MILYDQDFNFIGMSGETLRFLGYEDIDEFTSMHADFADLFIKKEGFIYKFDNFSWIHYILYSGAPNKKAYIRHKNGTEICADISIREVFLNHSYDNLRMIYSVKLINEGFAELSKSDIQDNRSANSPEFKLSNLGADLGITETSQQEVKQETPVKEPEPTEFKLDIPGSPLFEQSQTEVQEERTETTPETEFRLDLPTPPAEAVPAQTAPQETETDTMEFKLDIPPAESFFKTEETASTEPEATIPQPSLKPEPQAEEPIFKLDLEPQSSPESASVTEQKNEEPVLSNPFMKRDETDAATEHIVPDLAAKLAGSIASDKSDQAQEKQLEVSSQPAQEIAHPQERKENGNPLFSFKLLKEHDDVQSDATHHAQSEEPVDKTAQLEDKPLFSFDTPVTEKHDETMSIELQSMLKPEDENKRDTFTLEESVTQQAEPSPAKPASPFTFSLFDESDTMETTPASASDTSSATAEIEADRPLFDFPQHTDENQPDSIGESVSKSTLIEKIKSDIREIDEEQTPDVSEQEAADKALHELMQQSQRSDAETDQQQTKTSQPGGKTQPLFKFDMFTDTHENTAQPQPEIEEQAPAAETLMQLQQPEIRKTEPVSSFEETLKNIFNQTAPKSNTETKNLNIFDSAENDEKNKRSVTEEDIESPEQTPNAPDIELEMPSLGNLGLSREEELDFIEEFLAETANAIGLMQEYLALEDYDNIKYNLIKISSSAEILRFNQLLEQTRSLARLCDERAHDAVAKSLETLRYITERYQEHFATITV